MKLRILNVLRPGLAGGLLMVWSVGAAEPAIPSWCDVFTGGREGYPAYRIPALVTTAKGVLLAFAEGRATKADQSQNDIVLKRSVNGGRTWLPLQVVAEDGASSLNNPTAVVVRETGRVLLMFQRYPPSRREASVATGITGTNICSGWITFSDDEGATWARPVDITAQVKRPVGVTSIASGPGIGIQLRRGVKAGRVLIPFNEGPSGKWRVYAVYSDDRGASWKLGEVAPNQGKGCGNEVQMVELADGTVMLNARNQGGAKLRKTALSRDGGETWSPLTDDPNLPEPVCQASFLRYPDQDVFLFCNPATQTARTNGTVFLSRDEGKTWPVRRVVYPGSFAYSSLAALPDGALAVLFERDNYDRITLGRFTLEWLEAAK